MYNLYFSSRPSNVSALGLSFGMKECQFTSANRKLPVACFIRDGIDCEDGSALVGVGNDNLTFGVSSLFQPWSFMIATEFRIVVPFKQAIRLLLCLGDAPHSFTMARLYSHPFCRIHPRGLLHHYQPPPCLSCVVRLTSCSPVLLPVRSQICASRYLTSNCP